MMTNANSTTLPHGCRGDVTVQPPYKGRQPECRRDDWVLAFISPLTPRMDRWAPVRSDGTVSAVRAEWSQRLARFRSFIDGLAKPQDGEPQISVETARETQGLWWKLFGVCPRELSIPDVGPGLDGELLLIWKREEHYLAIQVGPGAPAEAFYRNHRTRNIWSVDFDPASCTVPHEVIEKLTIFVEKSDR